jgi:hypothetical protein
LFCSVSLAIDRPERIPDVQITKISSLFSILVECTQQNVKVLPGFTRGKDLNIHTPNQLRILNIHSPP